MVRAEAFPGQCLPTGNLIGSACYLCPAGTYGTGLAGREPCTPCGFGLTGPAGANDPADCGPVTQACPNGQGPFGDPQVIGSNLVSPETCACLPGYGGGAVDKPCQLCPPGTYSEGYTWEECKPCEPATFSPAGSTNAAECIFSTNFCPPGMFLPPSGAQAKEECVCFPGYGIVSPGSTAACTICPAGTFSPGLNLETCQSCGFGVSGPPGARDIIQCTICPTVSRPPELPCMSQHNPCLQIYMLMHAKVCCGQQDSNT
jgi:hypothetical protein